VDFTGTRPVERVARRGDAIRSSVLPELELAASAMFG